MCRRHGKRGDMRFVVCNPHAGEPNHPALPACDQVAARRVPQLLQVGIGAPDGRERAALDLTDGSDVILGHRLDGLIVADEPSWSLERNMSMYERFHLVALDLSGSSESILMLPGVVCPPSRTQVVGEPGAVAVDEGGAPKPRQGHAGSQRHTLTRPRGDLFLQGSLEGIWDTGPADSSRRRARAADAATPARCTTPPQISVSTAPSSCATGSTSSSPRSGGGSSSDRRHRRRSQPTPPSAWLRTLPPRRD